MVNSGGNRRLAAVWFADIVGYTELSARDADRAMRQVKAFQTAVRQQVRQHGGRLVKFIGDAALVEFPSADAAVRAALGLQHDTAAAQIVLRVGVHLGEIISTPDGDIYGDGVNLAARLQTEAEPNQILVSEDVWRQLRQRPDFTWESRGARHLKGIEDAVEAFWVQFAEGFSPAPTPEAHRSPEAPAPGHLLSGIGSPDAPVFVERARELAQLGTALERSLSGSGQVRLIAGEAGLGKSALVREFARRSLHAHPGLLASIGECNAQAGIGDAYLPFRDVIRQLLEIEDLLPTMGPALVDLGPDLVGTLVSGGSLLARLGIEVGSGTAWADRLETMLSQKPRTDSPSTSGVQQSQIFEQCSNVLRAVSAERPLMIVLDDLQWADEASLGLLFHLARRIEGSRILIVGTYRPNDVALGRRGDRHPLEPVVHELQRYFGDIQLDLTESDDAARRRMLDSLLDAQPNLLGSEFRNTLFGRTQGHPLFTVELLQHLRERGDLVQDAQGRWIEGPMLHWDAVPARVEGVIAERIGRLEQDLRDTLTVASVEGEDFTAEVVARVRTADERGVVKRLSGELEKQHHLIGAQGARRIGGQRISVYRFRHNFFQSYLYGQLDEVERSYLHEDVGRVLEELYAEQLDDVVVQLAHHFAESGDAEKAVTYLLKAGLRARRQYANAEAVTHFHRGLELLSRGGIEPARAEQLALQLNEELGDVLGLTARQEDARTAYRNALSLSGNGDRIREARLHRKVATTYISQHQIPAGLSAFVDAEAVLDQSAVARTPDWWHEWLQLQVEQMEAFYYSARDSDMAAVAERVRPIIDERGTPEQRAAFLKSSVQARMRRERYVFSPETLALSQAQIAVAEESGSSIVLCKAYFALGFLYLLRRELDLADEHLQTALALAIRTGNAWEELLCCTYLTTCARFRSDLEQVRERNDRAREVLSRDSIPTYAGVADSNLAWLAWRRGDAAAAEAHGQSALEHWKQSTVVYPFHWMVLCPLLVVDLAESRVGEAVEHARGMLDEKQQPLPSPLAAEIERAVSCWDAGKPDDARAHLDASLLPARELGYL